jgi:fructokinase
MLEFCELFDLETLVVTRGEEGAVACDRQQQHFVAVKPPESIAVVDTVGAGDAFAAILLLGLSRQWSLATILERAQAFACAVVGKRGATVADIGILSSIQRTMGLKREDMLNYSKNAITSILRPTPCKALFWICVVAW